ANASAAAARHELSFPTRIASPPLAAANVVSTDSHTAPSARATVRRTASTVAIGVARAAGSRQRVRGEPRSGRIRSTKRVNRSISGSRTATPTTLYAVWYPASSVTPSTVLEARIIYGIVNGKSTRAIRAAIILNRI